VLTQHLHGCVISMTLQPQKFLLLELTVFRKLTVELLLFLSTHNMKVFVVIDIKCSCSRGP